MRQLPLADPGTPDLRSPTRYLWWLARQQLSTLGGGLIFGITWMLAQALTPAAIGQGVNALVSYTDATGRVRRDHTEVPPEVLHHVHDQLWLWSGAVVALAVIMAASGVIRHRFAVSNWLVAAFRTAQLLGEHLCAAPVPITATIPTGDVVNTMASDAMRIGGAYDVIARFVGSIVAYLVVAIIMFQSSVILGLIVAIGVPVLVGVVSPLIKPMQVRQLAVREQAGKLTAVGADTVAGLRILRGIGGEAVFLDRYRSRSQAVRAAGVAAATPQALLDTAQIALPAVFILIVTFVGAHLTLTHQLSAGALVAFYGYAVFLVTPIRTATEFVERITRAQVGAGKVIRVLEIALPTPPAEPAESPPVGADLADVVTGLVVGGGECIGLVGTDPDATMAVAERLGGFAAPAGTFGEVSLTALATEEIRRRIVVSETEPRLFSGPLRTELSEDATDERLREALEVAAATEVIEGLPDGLDEIVEERGRGFSGGQRQRLTLARALLKGDEVLILIEPTSAVDAHTEAAIAAKLRAARLGRTTVVVTSSPLLLDHCDRVAYFIGDDLVATGTHRSLLSTEPRYAGTVLRGEG